MQRLLHETEAADAVFTLSAAWVPRLDPDAPLWGVSRAEHAVQRVLIYTGEVGNGGHMQFFLNRGGESAAPTLDALVDTGLSDLEDVLREACGVFDSPMPLSREQTEREIDRWTEDRTARFAPLDRRARRAPQTFERLLSFFRANESEVLGPERGLVGPGT